MPKFSSLSAIPRSVWILGCVSLFADINSKMVQSVLPLFLVSMGTPFIAIGLIEGTAESTASILKIFSGMLSDYWQRRKELAVIGYGLSTLTTPLFALATSSAWVWAARVGDRIGKGIRVAPRNALVADVTAPQHRGAAYGLRQSLDTVGAFLGPLIATAILLKFNQNTRLVFWFAVLPGVLAVLLLMWGVQERSRPATIPPQNPLRWQALKRLGVQYWMLVAVTLLFNLGNFSDAFLLLRAEEMNIPAALIPLSFVVMNLAYFASAYPIGVLSDRIGRRGLLISSFTLYALVYCGFAFVQFAWQVWILFACYGLYLGKSQGLLLAIVADQVPADLRGTAFGTMNLVAGVALLPASLIAGTLWQWAGASATFMTGAGFAIAAAISLTFTLQHDVQAD